MNEFGLSFAGQAHQPYYDESDFDPKAIPQFIGVNQKWDDLAEELKKESSSLQNESSNIDYSVWDLKIHPPEVSITDVNDFLHGSCTEISATSANRAGTLFQMVQVITEAELTIERAHISTDGRWFHDRILVQDPLTKGVIKDRKKRAAVESMLHVSTADNRDDKLNTVADLTSFSTTRSTVVDILAADRCGLFVDLLNVLKERNIRVNLGEVWTYQGFCAIVLSCTKPDLQGIYQALDESEQSVVENEMMKLLMIGCDEGTTEPTIRMTYIRGAIHQERRLHSLLFEQDRKLLRLWQDTNLNTWQAWQNSMKRAGSYSTDGYGSSGSRDGGSQDAQQQVQPLMHVPYVWDSKKQRLSMDYSDGEFSIKVVAKLTLDKPRTYIMVLIECPDRKKLLYDTLNTLTDLDYNIQHAEIRNLPGQPGSGYCKQAVQRYYVLPRNRDMEWREDVAVDLAYGLQSAILRRTPPGLKTEQVTPLDLSRVDKFLKMAKQSGWLITRAKLVTEVPPTAQASPPRQQAQSGLSLQSYYHPSLSNYQYRITYYIAYEDNKTEALESEVRRMVKQADGEATEEGEQLYGKFSFPKTGHRPRSHASTIGYSGSELNLRTLIDIQNGSPCRPSKGLAKGVSIRELNRQWAQQIGSSFDSNQGIV